ncbi:hypothetical protein AX16_005032 [Volvariella volvacea WC 439]|nr:hypothetical protein AX16_005032 [Volvariella volvacea WC 439]
MSISDTWSSMLPSFTGLTSFAMFAGSTQFVDGVKLLIFGQVMQFLRVFFFWLVERFRLQHCITAEFTEGDPVYEWMIHFLNTSNVWKQTRDFRVFFKTLKRRWSVGLDEADGTEAPAEYVPMYERPRLFRWRGYWVEVSRSNTVGIEPGKMDRVLYIKIYTLNMSTLSALINEAKQSYSKITHKTVTIYSIDGNSKYSPDFHWSNAKRKARRPLSSLVLPDGMLDSLVKDAQRFLESEEWYTKIGVPYRRGYLLYGPPGAGKTSTIYALAGELNLEIYTLPLSANFVDDGYLQRAAAAIPKRSILLIEDIDCAFPARDSEDDEEEEENQYIYKPAGGVTLSGLLNILDGVGSEEGRLFFATTNYMERLDSALIRPGRIDKKIEYSLASQAQAEALFLQIFPTDTIDASITQEKVAVDSSITLAKAFAEQAIWLNYRDEPQAALSNVTEWVNAELEDKRLRKEREEKRKQKLREQRRRRYAGYYAPPMEMPTQEVSKEAEEDDTAETNSPTGDQTTLVVDSVKSSDSSDSQDAVDIDPSPSPKTPVADRV